MIDFSNPKNGTEVELPELAASREISGARFVVQDVFQGGMGLCLKLRHVGTNETFALKVIKPEFLGEETTWARFIEELKWWLTLSACEGVAEAHCIATVNEIPCMCAAWLHHGNLRQFIGRGKAEFVFQTMLRIVRTLEWAYERHRVIHRDLKPENILLDQDWRAFVSDWGLAKALNSFFEESRRTGGSTQAGSPQITQAGHMVGTMLYAAPEQILGLSTVDHRADIYSLGCMLFEWETGRPPFWGRSHLEIAQQQVQAPPPKIGGLLRKTNLGLEKVIARCLEKAPGKRFQDYDSLARAMLEVAKRRGFHVQDFHPAERYHRAKPGSDELQSQLAAVEYSAQGYAVIEEKEMLEHVNQAMAEVALGNYSKAAKILAPFYIQDMCRRLRDWTICHSLAVNYGLCLSKSQNDQREAVGVFESLLGAEPKTPEFFVNYSLALLYGRQFSKAESVARQGLVANPRDKDLLGNLSSALLQQEKLHEALEIVEARLALGRDIHALEEAGNLLKRLAEQHREDWPARVKPLKRAVELLEEARHLNPRYTPSRFILAQVLHELEHYGDASKECADVFNLTDNQSLQDGAICLRAEILFDVSANQECLDFCNEWLPKLKTRHLAEGLERTRAKLIADVGMIGKEKDGKRVSVPDVVEFFKKKVENNPNALPEDAIYHARICEWLYPSDACFELLNWVESKKPAWWMTHYFRAEFFFRRNSQEAALEEIRKAVACAPYRSGPLRQLAFFHERRGNSSEAERIRKEAEAVAARRKEIARIQR